MNPEKEYFIGTKKELLIHINSYMEEWIYVSDLTEICLVSMEHWEEKNLYLIQYLW